ncbi:helix-turn-helix transcriptional regulator [Sphingomonas immobilis]|uniref:HTH luxR-type domain-containing protein n=1 Tax=Sphingomonas immobilis TaxID=3063997 RepID=A0ABT8ZX17_9SPHN|nr:hypothetical protein [Sphingomonas sp. CA1-15]MDO7842127.1 hypothetical protein [Sphingomonas sp. CA1-15]
MAITRQDETDLLTALHDGVLEDAPWATFLRRLRGRLRADDARLRIARPAAPDLVALEFFAPAGHGTPAPVPAIAPFPAALARLRPNRVYGEEEIPADTAAYRRILRVVDDAGASAWLDVTRAQGAFSAADSAMLSQLGAHLAIALRTFVALTRARAGEAAAARGLERLGTGWVMLDRRGHVLGWSAQAERLLHAVNPGWRGHDGAMRLGRAMDAAIARGGHHAIRLRADPPVDAMLAPVADAAGAVITGAAVLIQVRGAPESGPAKPLADLLGVPLFEARLAARLAAGDSIAEGAEALGLTIETARNYSKRLYARTGTRGQADLVRAVLESGAPLA